MSDDKSRQAHDTDILRSAAKAAMYLMRNGGSAVDAVEMAIKVLEDREITNAGYGSNLTMDGVVECDAVVVDHFGRSGAAGAVARMSPTSANNETNTPRLTVPDTEIKNPISLARLLLDRTTQTLSLRRVPPNLLVGQGATDFAYEHGMPVLPLDCLISPAASDRWRRWREDLERAERHKKHDEPDRYPLSPYPSQTPLANHPGYSDETERMRRAHTYAMRASVWNEAQPISPPPPDTKELDEASSSSPSKTTSSRSMELSDETDFTSSDRPEEYMDPYGPPGMLENASKNPFNNSTQKMLAPMALGRGGDGRSLFSSPDSDLDMDLPDVARSYKQAVSVGPTARRNVWQDGSSDSDSDSTTLGITIAESNTKPRELHGATLFPMPDPPSNQASSMLQSSANAPLPAPDPPKMVDDKEDAITDTVGAVAVDTYGNIACGASSGGIGMKHRGRIGPAALVGIGAAVIPVDEADSERTTVATVTSGTGEHMGTTMAAVTCSDRIYHNVRKAANGGYEECAEDEAIHHFIQKDFMDHPSVRQSHSTGAIGVLSVKKSKDGVYLYFGHNTDSFALASMHSDEAKPVCTMSRSKGGGIIAQGGRAIRYKKRKG